MPLSLSSPQHPPKALWLPGAASETQARGRTHRNPELSALLVARKASVSKYYFNKSFVYLEEI